MALVTGASSGFSGSERGARETLRTIREGKARGEMGSADLRDPGSVVKLFTATEAAFGGLDIVVCNAGAYLDEPLAETTDEEFDHVFGGNARGTFLCLREAWCCRASRSTRAARGRERRREVEMLRRHSVLARSSHYEDQVACAMRRLLHRSALRFRTPPRRCGVRGGAVRDHFNLHIRAEVKRRLRCHWPR